MSAFYAVTPTVLKRTIIAVSVAVPLMMSSASDITMELVVVNGINAVLSPLQLQFVEKLVVCGWNLVRDSSSMVVVQYCYYLLYRLICDLMTEYCCFVGHCCVVCYSWTLFSSSHLTLIQHSFHSHHLLFLSFLCLVYLCSPLQPNPMAALQLHRQMANPMIHHLMILPVPPISSLRYSTMELLPLEDDVQSIVQEREVLYEIDDRRLHQE